MDERQLIEAVQMDERSVKSGLVTDDGTVSVGGKSSAPSGTLMSTDFTTETELRSDHPVTMKLLDIFDYFTCHAKPLQEESAAEL